MNQISKSDLSALPLLLGSVVIASSILYSVFVGFSLVPFCLCLLGGLFIGVPLIGLSSTLNCQSSAPPEPFLPSRKSVVRLGWDALLLVSFVSVPAFLASIFLFIPNGDSWTLAITRVALLTLFLLATYFWIKRCPPILVHWFRGRASDEVLEKLSKSPAPAPFSLPTECWNCLGILSIAAIAFCIVFGVIDFNDQWLQMNIKGPRRFRGLAHLLMWCRGNPNSIWSTSLLIGIGALGAFFYQVAESFRSWQRSQP